MFYDELNSINSISKCTSIEKFNIHFEVYFYKMLNMNNR